MKHTVVLVPGDGIGPEITGAVLRILEVAGVDIEWVRHEAGSEALANVGTPLPDALLAAIDEHKVALKGPLTTPVGSGFPSVNVALRKHFDLFANLRPTQTLPGMELHHGEIDLVVVRENTEDLYAGLEHVVVPGVVESLKIITEKACRRISEFAFEYAVKNDRKKITAVHKANIMKLSDGLFLDCARKVAERYPQITYQEMIVDNTAMQLVMRPQQFDMLLLENLYGDILSDLCAGLVGGLGVVPGANIGDTCAVFEAVHGSAPDIAGKNLANPLALIMSGVMMLNHIGEAECADRIKTAYNTLLAEKNPDCLTPDIGGRGGTTQFTQALIRTMQK